MDIFLRPWRRKYPLILILLLSALLTACGGNKDDEKTTQAPETGVPVSAVAPVPPTRVEAARFLTQATFGPTDQAIQTVMAEGYSQWLENQFAEDISQPSYKAYWDARDAQLRSSSAKSASSATGAYTNELNHVFWTRAVTGKDQLRQRVALALSEIFVISVQDGCGLNNLGGAASYMDMLSQRAFGTYRELLEAVALHPIMGCYLSHLKNQKEDASGRMPDENFAREVMQLFSIGLVMLNEDGTPKESNGFPIESYSGDDVSGLAKVFTGWSFDCPRWPAENCFTSGMDNYQSNANMWSTPMRSYPVHHSTSVKKFLQTTIPEQTTADPEGDLEIALDALASHPNTAPFISKQLIQRLVTSNPSPAYVKRVATVFRTSNGDLRKVVKAILMDAEARDYTTAAKSDRFGKVREPLLRLSALFRAYGASSATGAFLMWTTNDPGTALAQAPLQAPSVFNYFRPGYTPPNSATAKGYLVAPEMQILNETSAAGYVNYIKDGLWGGWGACGYENKNCKSKDNLTGTPPDIQLSFQLDPNSAVLGLTNTPTDLVEDVNQRLMYGTMPADLKAEIAEAVGTVYVGSKTKQSAADALDTARRRVMTALLLTMASPEFQVQR